MVTGGEGVPMPVTLHLSWELPDIFSLTHKHTQQNCTFVYLLLFFKVLCAFLDLFGTDAGVGDPVCLLASSLTPSIMREITAQKNNTMV